MLVGIKRETHGRDAGDAIAFKHRHQFALRRFQPDDQAFGAFILTHRCGHGVERAGEIVGHRQNVTREIGGGIGTGILRVFFQTAAHILRLGLRVKDLLARLFQFAKQSAKRVGSRFGFGTGIFRVCVVLQLFVAHYVINLVRVCAVKSTMGTTRA